MYVKRISNASLRTLFVTHALLDALSLHANKMNPKGHNFPTGTEMALLLRAHMQITLNYREHTPHYQTP